MVEHTLPYTTSQFLWLTSIVLKGSCTTALKTQPVLKIWTASANHSCQFDKLMFCIRQLQFYVFRAMVYCYAFPNALNLLPVKGRAFNTCVVLWYFLYLYICKYSTNKGNEAVLQGSTFTISLSLFLFPINKLQLFGIHKYTQQAHPNWEASPSSTLIGSVSWVSVS